MFATVKLNYVFKLSKKSQRFRFFTKLRIFLSQEFLKKSSVKKFHIIVGFGFTQTEVINNAFVEQTMETCIRSQDKHQPQEFLQKPSVKKFHIIVGFGFTQKPLQDLAFKITFLIAIGFTSIMCILMRIHIHIAKAHWGTYSYQVSVHLLSI